MQFHPTPSATATLGATQRLHARTHAVGVALTGTAMAMCMAAAAAVAVRRGEWGKRGRVAHSCSDVD